MRFDLAGWAEKSWRSARRRGAVVLMLSGTLSGTWSAAALTPAELLTPDLEREAINLSGLHQGVLNFFDGDRRLAQRPTRDFVRLVFPAEATATDLNTIEADPGVTVESASDTPPTAIELIDGQRLIGAWGGAARDGEAIVWLHPALGRFTLGLDDVRIVGPASGGRALRSTATAEDDVIIMANGDQLTGFVVGVDDLHVSILSAGSEAEVKLPVASMRSLSLANPASDPGIEGDLITLVDGSRVRGTGVSIRGATLRMTPALADDLRPVELPLTRVKHVDFAASGKRLIDLSTLPMRVTAGGEAFGLALPPSDGDEGLRLHAPVTVSFALPAGATRFATSAALDLPVDLPSERRGWADMLLWVNPDQASVPSTNPAAVRLRASTPEAELNVALDPTADQITLQLDPGINGPILDRLRLRNAVLLIETPDPRPETGDTDR